MAQAFDPKQIDAKWQAEWLSQGTYRAEDLPVSEKDRKFYGLVEFPYPSGEGLHVGHPRSYTAIDIMTRKQRMAGKNVLYPMGWDAFGLPTENFAIKHKIRPQDATVKNIANFRRQIQSIGIGFDWSREVDTTDPKYYKWTQWMFLKFFESYFDEIEGRAKPISQMAIPSSVSARGEQAVREFIDSRRMAYKSESTINWCPRCKIGLANEEAQGGVCERCGNAVEQRIKKQWMIRITSYADRLIDDLLHVDYLEKIKSQQINWIGRSKGAYVDFSLKSGETSLIDKVTVFTTRPDTLFGATYLVLAPEHPLIETWMKEGRIENADEVVAYQEGTKLKSDLQRQENKEKTGVVLKGLSVMNPANGKSLSIWIADYVLGGYGTGAIMAVPAHDERDFAFAKMFKLPIKAVISPEGNIWREHYSAVGKKLPQSPQRIESPAEEATWQERLDSEYQIFVKDVCNGEICWTHEGLIMNSDFLNGLSSGEAKEKMIEWLELNAKGQYMTTYRLRDWVFSRQRYWGEPIPIIDCPTCGYVPVSESQLPVILPEVKEYEPTDTGESPLAAIRSWVEVECPSCHGKAERETDTMPSWAGSSWYFLRYCDPNNDQEFASAEKLKYWMPVDLYNGGMEHTTLHLLYSRFWYKFMWDLGLIPHQCGSEPYMKRRSHALIMGEGGIKMSKSKGNVVNPDDVVGQYGADVFRMYEMFIGPFDQDAPWDTNGIEGVKRFLEKVWKLSDRVGAHGHASGSSVPVSSMRFETEVLLHQTIKKVTEDIEGMHFNTAVSAMMILVNGLLEETNIPQAEWESFLKILAPFAPHVTEELWSQLGHSESIHRSGWPVFDSSKLRQASFEMVVQVNGKVRDKMTVDASISEEEAKAMALASEKVRSFMGDAAPQKVIYVKGKLVSISV